MDDRCLVVIEVFLNMSMLFLQFVFQEDVCDY